MTELYSIPANNATQAPKRPKVVMTFKEFVQDNTPLEFIVDGLLPDAGWTLLVGLPGVGKSTFAAQLCCALQDGTSFMGFSTKQRSCLYIQCDTPTSIWREQIRKIGPQSTALTMQEVPAQALDQEIYIEVLAKVIAYYKPGFIVFDALNSLTGRDINTKQGMVPIFIMDRLARTNREGVERKIPWMLLHHPTKGTTKGVNSASGFGGISGACATHLTLMPSRLKIEKGKLSAKRSIDLLKDDQGIWFTDDDAIPDEELNGYKLTTTR